MTGKPTRYRQMKTGEIIQATDEYIPVRTPNVFIPVAEVSIGQPLYACNEKYYRRPIEPEQEADAAITEFYKDRNRYPAEEK